ncbi:MAG: gliding motility-associated C-terminal domain-containing protein [Flavobacteriales bacterium]
MAVLLALTLPRWASAQVIICDEDAQVETCAGSFSDSGGPGGNYGNNESITVTICPTGGPGSGPNTSVTFTSWDLAGGGDGDHLHIFDGTGTGGSPMAIGDHDDPFLGDSFVATNPSGCLTFRWESDNSGTGQGYAADITTGPSAGSNANLTLCTDGSSFTLTTQLGGVPDAGGSWSAPGGAPHASTFDLSSDPGGIWTYTVSGPAPCPDSSATLSITLVDAPNAGISSALSVCADGAPVDLFLVLGGAPDAGGNWTGPLGPHSNMFDPATDPAGIYTYTVGGVPPCGIASADVTVTVNQPVSAGTNGNITVCDNAAPFSLFALLGGAPDPGGAWTGPGATPVPDTYTPGTSVAGIYTYAVLGVPPCANATATVTVAQVGAPDAGTDNTITVCSSDATFPLISRLNGTPDAGGTWIGPVGAHGPSFNPATDVSGAYTYTVVGTPPCSNATATVNITLRQAPNAGANGLVTVCSTDGSFALFALIGGTPDVGGTWTAPNSQVHSGTFVPGTDQSGTYTYTVTGQSPCLPDVATVIVTVNTAPNAGTGGTVVRCSNDAAFSLFTQLGGSPTSGGTWTGPSGAHGATFTPGTDPAGVYTYLVAGQAPCSNATSVLNVSVVSAPNAGINGATTVCSTDAPFGLAGFLTGSPDANGTWTGPAGANNGTFVPGTSTPGTYTYTVPGQSPCANDLATVQVTVVQPPSAGTNASLTVCSDAPPVDLFALLGGSPTAGGSWTRPNGTAHSGTYLPGTEVGGTYTYTVVGAAPCANATATVQIVRVIAPNAGTNGNTTVCSTNSAFALLGLLGGTPSGTGTWRDPSNAVFSGTFVPGTSAPGVYAYVVTGAVPCGNDTAFVTVAVNIAPNAGTNGATTVCSSAAPFNLFPLLGGTPGVGGSWTRPNGTPSTGTYTPGVSSAGGYTYIVSGTTPCLDASAVVVVSENRQPVAGTNAAFQRCSTDGPVDLFTILGGVPDAGGAWSGPGGASSGIFIPGTSLPGVYTYTVTGTAPCTNVTATVTATVNLAPNAGTDGDLTVCGDQSVVDLMTGLGGTPDGTGIWSDDDNTGQLSGNLFSPLGLPPGDYHFTYTVPGSGQCGDASAEVTVTIVAGLDAGNDGNLTVCNSTTAVNLFLGLGGSPQPGGVWIELSGTSAVTGQVLDATLVPPGSYQFRYRLNGTVSCLADSAVVTVNVVAAPNAGTSASVTACSNGASFNLFTALGGNPQGAGIWRCGPTTVSNIYSPPTQTPCAFTYTVNGTAPCPNAVSTVTVTEVPAPNAGSNNLITVCSNSGPFNMTLQLGGSPQVGVWTFNGQPHSAIFDPSVDAQGIYIYTVTGTFPCGPAVATLTISIVPASNAGTNASATVCSSDTPFLLFGLLGGGAQAGGTWTAPDSSPHNGVYIPGTSDPGDYIYTVAGVTPCTADVSVVSIFENEAPDAGISSTITLCLGGGNVNLLTFLGGTPDASGTWVGPAPTNPPFSGLFVPGTSAPGTYTYVVTGAAPCVSDMSTVTVAVSTPPNAGLSNAITRCSNNPGFPMVDFLLGTPAFNGTWVGPAPGNPPSNGFFIPGTTAPGLYTYTVTGTPPCANATATLNITVNPAANAGNDATLTLCNTSGVQDLFLLLGPNAQVGGSWTGPGGAHSGTFLPGTDTPGPYVYTVPGLPPCANDQAVVTVVVNTAPIAGSNGLLIICSSEFPFPLIDVLNGSPAPGGTWMGPAPSTAPHSGIFLPGTNQAGVYTYTVSGTAPCSNATAQATIIQNEATDAGQNGVIAVCSSAVPFNLFDHLTDTPDSGGDWYAPDGSPLVGSTYIPGTSEPGEYTYRVEGVAPCADDSATVTVIENIAPDAGISTVALVCSDTVAFPLADLLGGTPDLNGTWTFNSNLHGPVFDPTVDISGAYVYTVSGAAPCIDAFAQVQITRVPAPNAGNGGAIASCIDDPAISLALGLGGSPNGGGIWNDDDGTGQLNGAVFNAVGLPAGTYHFTYTVVGISPCGSSSTTVTVNIAEALFAGVDSTASVCESELPCLFDLLGPDAQAGGIWVDVDNSGALVGCAFDASTVAEGTTWRFDYVLPASGQCESDTARVTITVLDGPSAGCDGFMNLCANSAPVQLANALGCDPDPGGFWLDPFGVLLPVGTFLPATGAPGTYSYVVPGIGTCPSDTSEVTVGVTQPPNAGNDADLAICSSDGAVDMFTLLGPNAEAGGVWTFGGGPNPPVHSNFYNPAIDVQGTYRYTVMGAPPCANDAAFVTVTEHPAPNAGCDGVLTVCSDQDPVLLRSFLGCSPQTNGTWMGPSGPHGNFFDPAVDEPGVYTYTVDGIAPCEDATAELTISVTPAVNAGEDAEIFACLDQAPLNLFDSLGTGAQTGGVWTDVDGSGALVGDIFTPSVAGNGTWNFTYALPSNGPCVGATTEVIVHVGSGSSAGGDSTVTVCGSETAYALFDALAGSPAVGGSWSDPTGTGALLADGILDVSALPIGGSSPFVYTIIDPGCGTAFATVLVTAAAYPVAGTGTSLTLCSTAASIDLFAQLTGGPQTGGVWTGPGGPHSATFDPGVDPSGEYTYTVAGNTACPDATAVVDITINEPPDAGADGELLACDTVVALDLFTGLLGAPQVGGTWVDLDGAGGLTGGMLNTTGVAPGEYDFSYTVSASGCGNASAQVNVVVVSSVHVIDVVGTCNEEDRTYVVSFTIEQGDAATYQVTGLDGVISPGPVYVFTSIPLFTSQDFEAFVQDQYSCGVVHVVGGTPCVFEDDVFVPETFSPNGDGVNETFLIPGIEGYPNNTLVIFNRWGGEIYDGVGYDNRTVVWDGTSPNAALAGPAPAGTYFYILDLGNGKEALTGYVYLNR